MLEIVSHLGVCGCFVYRLVASIVVDIHYKVRMWMESDSVEE